MSFKILFILSSYNIYSGTPKKTLDLAKHFRNNAVIYVYSKKYPEFKPMFETTGAKVYQGYYGKNMVKHITKLRRILVEERIDIVQTQFVMGGFLGFITKILKPRIKLVIAFVGALKPKRAQIPVLRLIFNKADFFIYISKYVKAQKESYFPFLKKKLNRIIYNGASKINSIDEYTLKLNGFSVLAVSGLIPLKNIQILIEAMNILINQRKITDIYMYVAGDGPMKAELLTMIKEKALNKHIFLLGYQKNIGKLISDSNIFVHPSYNEGFGIAVAEAMMAKKPIIVSKAGALTELLEHEKTGLVVDPFNAQQWADAIIRYKKDQGFSEFMAENAKRKASNDFSAEKFVNNYERLYLDLLARK